MTDAALRARFWAKVDVRGPDECWPWTGARDHAGYGRFGIPRPEGGKWKAHRANRVAWELTHGPIPPGLFACHQCDNPPCCNPAHLFLGTPADNLDDMRAKGRNRDVGATVPARGRRLPQTKLSDRQVHEVRVRYATGGVTQRALAGEFGVSQATISLVVQNEHQRTDGYVPPAPHALNRLRKVTPEQVREIRARHAAGERVNDLERAFGLGHGYVSQIVNGKRRASVV